MLQWVLEDAAHVAGGSWLEEQGDEPGAKHSVPLLLPDSSTKYSSLLFTSLLSSSGDDNCAKRYRFMIQKNVY